MKPSKTLGDAGAYSEGGIIDVGITQVPRGGAGSSHDIAVNKSTTLHELQHAIQQREGMARGGSPESMYQTKTEALARVRHLNNELSKSAKDLDVYPKGSEEYQYARETYDAAMAEKLNISPMIIQDDPYKLYQSLAGETEARLVQDRMDMPMSERLKAPFYKSYDVPLDEQIVRYGEGASLSRNGEKITQPGAHDKYSLESYNRSQVTGKKARNLKPGRIKDLR
ncbi:hypothetical protein, partial [Moraxella sp.]|uniref:hypothetical protein n=1 Tax=Moraxella sp. TaxID=479 RepID=UPI00261304CA